jgi:hypothetical protein
MSASFDKFENMGDGKPEFFDVINPEDGFNLAYSIRRNTERIAPNNAATCYAPQLEPFPKDIEINTFLRLKGKSGENILMRTSSDSNYKPAGPAQFLIDTPSGFFVAEAAIGKTNSYDDDSKRGPIANDSDELFEWADLLSQACEIKENGFAPSDEKDVAYCTSRLLFLQEIFPSNVPFEIILDLENRNGADQPGELIDEPLLISNIYGRGSDGQSMLVGNVYMEYSSGSFDEDQYGGPTRRVTLAQGEDGSYGLAVKEDIAEKSDITAEDLIFSIFSPSATKPLTRGEVYRLNNKLHKMSDETMVAFPEEDETLTIREAIKAITDKDEGEELERWLIKAKPVYIQALLDAANSYKLDFAAKVPGFASVEKADLPSLDLYGQSGPANITVIPRDDKNFMEIKAQWMPASGIIEDGPALLIRSSGDITREAFIPEKLPDQGNEESPNEINSKIYKILNEDGYSEIRDDVLFHNMHIISQETASTLAKYIRLKSKKHKV